MVFLNITFASADITTGVQVGHGDFISKDKKPGKFR